MATNLDSIVPDLNEEERAALEGVEEAPEQLETPAEEATEEASEDLVEERRVVDYGALTEERGRRRELERELASTKETMASMESRFQEVLKRVNPQEQEPDFDEDPAANLRFQIGQLQRQLETVTQGQQKAQQQTDLQAQNQAFLNRYSASIRAYTEKEPAFRDAYPYLAESVDKELQARGFEDPNERAQILQQEEAAIVHRAWNDGKDPAEVIYNLAVHRGFKKAAGNKIETLAKGQKANKSLSSAANTSQETDVSLERLAELNGEEFDKAFEKLFYG